MPPKTKLNKREALNGVIQNRAATLSGENKTDGTLTFVMVSDNNEGTRFDWGSGQEYIERLDIDGANASALNTFFKNHDRGVDDAIGKVTNTRKEGKELLADVMFDEDGVSIERKYKNGTLTDVSIGYRINQYEVTEREGELDLVTITNFDILELSAVGIGFDSGAKHTGRNSILNTGEEEMPKELLERLEALETMAKRTKDQETELLSVRKEIEDARVAETAKLVKQNAALTRTAEIATLTAQYAPSDALRAKFEIEGEPSDYTRAILDEKAKAQPTFHAQPKSEDIRTDMLDAISDALALNAGIRIEAPHKDATMFRGASMTDIAKKVCDIRSFDKNEIASRAMVSADFPLLLSNIGNKVLNQGYEEEASSFEMWTKQVDVQDFKTNTDITKGTSGRLQKLNESGEIKEKQLGEAGEEWAIESFANEFAITRKMIVNDDLGAFNDLLSEFGKMAKRTANGLTYDLLQGANDYSGYLMKDGIAIFDASTHKNYTSSGTALSATSLEAARVLMQRQTSVAGDAFNILPRYLIVAPEQEITALTLINSTASTVLTTNSGVNNPFQNSLQVVVDSELAAGAWYLAGGSRTIKAGYLAGTGRRPIIQLDSTSLTKTVFQGVFDFGVVAEDYRSLYKNVGA